MVDILKRLILIVGLITVGTLSIPFVFADDNEIHIKNQEGDNFNLQIDQIGYNNTIQCYIASSCWTEGTNMSLHFHQQNFSDSENKIEIWHLEGNNNSIRWGQGAYLDGETDTTFSWDGQESGGHYARHDIHGHSNTIAGYQQNGGGQGSHHYESLIFSDDNDIWIRQKNNGDKWLSLRTDSDGNDISILQKTNHGEHSATIRLMGTEPTTLNLIQKSQTNQTYNLQQTCYTTGGCNVSVTQGN